MNNPKLSVCMVAYNQELFIGQAVESVLSQKVNFPIEIVIGEDCSTDRTAAIIRDLAAKAPGVLRPRFAERNVGAKENFLATIAECHGEYVAMLEGDDYWTCDDKLQMQVDALEAHKEWAMCFHPTACVYEDGLQGHSVYPPNWIEAESTIQDLLSGNFIPTNSVVFRNNLFGAFPPWFRDLKLGDWPLHILNAAHGKIGFLPQVMSAYRVHRKGIWNGETPAGRIAAIFKMFTAVDHHFAGKYSLPIEKYRLDAVAELMADIDAAKRDRSDLQSQFADLQNEKAQLRSEFETLNASLAATKAEYAELSHTARTLQASNAELSERAQTLQAFYDDWSSTMYYRVGWETKRLWKRAHSYFTGINPRNKKPPRQNPSPTSKAA
jgi:glycosyltransferase involved in cell wall biosynthesis